VGVDLTTQYLGFTLRSPLVASSSPMTIRIDALKRLEENGAGAVVLPSLFQEQIEQTVRLRKVEESASRCEDGWADDPQMLSAYNADTNGYLRAIEDAKRSVSIPIIASLNGNSQTGWEHYSRLIQAAGADALELNILDVPFDPNVTGADLEQTCLDVIAAIRTTVTVPLAVKIGPYFSALPNFARRAVNAGADALVLFNRYPHPDIDIETLTARSLLELSRPDDVRLTLRWVAILYGQVRASLAASGGVHFAEEAIKVLLAGADVAMVASTLLLHGPDHIGAIVREVSVWIGEHGYRSVEEIKGRMSRQHCPDPTAFERADYLRALESFIRER
jgi:dihydroorotate dehydrogenase (fumarate)